jgi:hypothetical protein
MQFVKADGKRGFVAVGIEGSAAAPKQGSDLAVIVNGYV